MPAAAVIPTLKVYVKVVAVKTLVVGLDGVLCVVFFGRVAHRGQPGHFSPPLHPGCVTLNKLWCSKHVYCGGVCVSFFLVDARCRRI